MIFNIYIAACLAAWMTWIGTTVGIVRDCNTLGMFRDGSTIYLCEKRDDDVEKMVEQTYGWVINFEEDEDIRR